MADIFVAQKPHLSRATLTQAVTVQTPSDPPGLTTSYRSNPALTSFASQEPNEQILLFLRRHFITNVPWISLTILLLLLPPFFTLFFHFDNPFTVFFPNGVSGRYTFVLLLFYYLVVLAFAFVNFLSWFFSISLVTTERVFDIDYSSLVYKNVGATKINLVEDVSFSQIGTIRSTFDYGDVLVQTAGTIDNFDLSAVPHPGQVVDTIEELIGKGDDNA